MPRNDVEDRDVVVAYLATLKEESKIRTAGGLGSNAFRWDMYAGVDGARASRLAASAGLAGLGVAASTLGVMVFVIMDAISPSTNQIWIVMTGIGLILGPALTALQLCIFPVMLLGRSMILRFVIAILTCIPGVATFFVCVELVDHVSASNIAKALSCLWTFVLASGMISLILQYSRGWRLVEFGVEERAVGKLGIRWMIELTGLAAFTFVISGALDLRERLFGVIMLIAAAIPSAIACALLLHSRLRERRGSARLGWLALAICISSPFAALLVIHTLEPSFGSSTTPVMDWLYLLGCATPGGLASCVILRLGVRHLERCGWRLFF